MVSKKICLLGDFSVGKTSAVARCVRQTFSETYLTTIGVKIDTKLVERSAASVRLVLWDIAGSSRMGQSRLNYLRGADGFVLVADGTRRETVSVALDLWQQANQALRVETSAVLLLNKLDLADDWEISPELLESLSRVLPVFCTSARTGEAIESAFTEIAFAVEAAVDV